MGDQSLNDNKRAEVYTYDSDNLLYALGWSVRSDKKYRLAVGSFREDCTNVVDVVKLDKERGKINKVPHHCFSHPYPPTKLMFMPDREGCHPDLLATTGDFLRIWRLHEDSVTMEKLLNNSVPWLQNRQNIEFCAPLTSFDWNDNDLKRLGTSSIDTTCTIWDIEKGVVDTQLIAHDKEVYDIAWGGVGVFATVSADGSVRVFDLRDKEHSTIIYESPQRDVPLLRLGWNKQDPRFMATIMTDSCKVIILDIRIPTLPITELQRHQSTVNSMCWAPHSSCHICTAGDDAQALIWDLTQLKSRTGHSHESLDPILAYNAGQEINQLQWSSSQPDWLAICFGKRMQILRV